MAYFKNVDDFDICMFTSHLGRYVKIVNIRINVPVTIWAKRTFVGLRRTAQFMTFVNDGVNMFRIWPKQRRIWHTRYGSMTFVKDDPYMPRRLIGYTSKYE